MDLSFNWFNILKTANNLHTDYNLAADYVLYADYNPNTEYNLHTNYNTEFMNSQIHVVMCLTNPCCYVPSSPNTYFYLVESLIIL